MDRQLYTSEIQPETALLIGVQHSRLHEWEVRDHLEELALLCHTAGAVVVGDVVVRIGRMNSALYIGSGKAEEIAARVREEGISTVVFDDDLTPAQGRNLEKLIGTKVIDRTQVILHIFAQHARSREGQMQIELAQLEYLLPRLRRMWTHLERQKGGMGMHGPGEKQLELDRRRILERIDRFRGELQDVRRHRTEQRRGRRRHGWSLVSLVGYTNAGKSTLLNALTGAEVYADDKLFATLDPTTRQLRLSKHQQLLLTDTVGFIRKLPHGLVEAFKATLEEVAHADLLLHVIDAAHPRVEEQVAAVDAVLQELGVQDKPVLYVLNKMDEPDARLRAAMLARKYQPAVEVSALRGEGFDALRDALADALQNRAVRAMISVPLSEARLLASIRSGAAVHSCVYEDERAIIEGSFPPRLWGSCKAYTLDPVEEVEES
ncbi:MAG: GTPase HflX [Verrucomicrobia bacterium]|nr:GTPase HflX [Kiritimatiellia bacterium]MCO6400278.1 GTPase HflX [Verrucomicrobiota bacterium]